MAKRRNLLYWLIGKRWKVVTILLLIACVLLGRYGVRKADKPWETRTWKGSVAAEAPEGIGETAGGALKMLGALTAPERKLRYLYQVF